MSDLLSRIAARAVGAAAVARPRVPGAFEDDAASGPAVIEVVDEQVVAQAGPAEVDPGAPTPSLGAPAAPASARPARPADDGPRPPVEARPPRPPSDVGRPATPTGLELLRPARQAPDDPPPTAHPQVRTRLEALAPQIPVAAVPVTPAPPALVGAPEPAAPTPRPEAQEEPPAVRVHIGRLEVRASVRDAAQERPRRPGPPPRGLSLADYLRGRREPA